ncbi:hypothetical protein F383_07792 [Gossypium arboreum]|nr:hypothetical protein F383_07792 [Gossypium arboreum]
MGNPTRV